MSNITNATQGVDSRFTNFVIVPFSIATIIINVFFLIMGIKTLKKKAHNMLVISMCFGDCLYGFSLFILAVRNLMPINEGITQFCISQITMIFISMTMSLTVACMICIERFITIRMSNFGMLARSEGWKKIISICALFLTTSYVAVCVISVPRRQQAPTTKACYMRLYYDPYNYQVITSLLSGLFLILALMIIVLYIGIAGMLCKFMEQTNRVVPKIVEKRQSKDNESMTTARDNTQRLDNTTGLAKTSGKSSDKLKNNETTSAKQKTQIKQQIWTKKRQLGMHGIVLAEGDPISVSNIHVAHRTFTKINPMPLDEDNRESSNRHSSESPTSSSIISLQDDQLSNRSREIQSKDLWKEWELRAIATSGYIIGSTLLLQGPLITSLLADAIGNSFSPAIGNLAAILVALQCVINPFLYALRFKELRTAMKNVICCKKDQSNQISITTNGHGTIELREQNR